MLKKITGSIEFVNDKEIPIKIENNNDDKNMHFLISKIYVFDDEYYNSL
ncbi:MAG: hypothetical protein LBC39_08900 [Methanobrevibacter sp.]|jgi:hypothetical protein|nr:hypothetical protein [Candidatus Methanovirga aequatorialis]